MEDMEEGTQLVEDMDLVRLKLKLRLKPKLLLDPMATDMVVKIKTDDPGFGHSLITTHTTTTYYL